MGVIGIAVAVVVALWIADRLIRGRRATKLRDRKDAKQVAGISAGVAEALPFLGQQTFHLPQPPPPVEYEPEQGSHTIVLSPRDDADGT